MQFYLCPRCQFRVPAKKNACTTCGFDITPLKNVQADEPNQNARPSIFTRLLGKEKETGKEKHALS